MLTMSSSDVMYGVAGSASAITYTLTGDEKSGVTDTFKVLAQGVLPSGIGSIYAPATAALVQKIMLVNTTAGAVTVQLGINGTIAANRIANFSIPANGFAIFAHDGWRIHDSTGALLTAFAPVTATGDATGTQSGSNLPLTLATVNANVGAFGSATQVGTFTVDGKGRTTAAGNVAIAIPESAVTNLVTDLAGKQPTGNYLTAITGDLAAAGPGSSAGVLATVNANVGSFGSASAVGAFTVNAKGLTTAASAIPIVIAESAVTNLVTDLAAKVPTARTITTTSPLTIDGGGSADLSANRTLNMPAATPTTAGHMSALDKKKLDNIWIDVTANSIALVLPANTAAQNITAMNAILSGAPNGSTIFFPHGTTPYLFNAVWTYPAATAKMFIFKGEGSNRAGSPATTFTELQWTANVGGDIITLPGSGNGWYTEFHDLTFTSSATQSAGALVNVNGNVGTNFSNCSFQSTATGNTWFDVLNGSGGSSNSWNSAVIENCSFQGFTNSAIRVNSSGSSLVISNCVIQGQWGSTTQIAASCVSGGWVGALQLIGCDILGAVNNLLLNPVLASSEVCASVQCTNTYFDFAGGSCIKITGTGATVRCKWDTCTFTTSNAGAMSYSAVEIAGSFAWTTGGQDLAFVNCNIYNTFGTTGTTNGVLITNAADVSFVNCKVAGWTNGYNVTPISANRTNVQVLGGTVGPSGGYGGNTTGFNIVGGAYKGLQIRANNCIGNGTNLTLGAVTVLAGEGSLFAITENAGINPRGTELRPVNPPVAGTTYTNTTGFRVSVHHKNSVAPTAVTINGLLYTVTLLTSQVFSTTLEPGGTISFTAGTHTSWSWVGQ